MRASIKEYTTAAFYNDVGRCSEQFIPSLVLYEGFRDLFRNSSLPLRLWLPAAKLNEQSLWRNDSSGYNSSRSREFINSACETCRKAWVLDSQLHWYCARQDCAEKKKKGLCWDDSDPWRWRTDCGECFSPNTFLGQWQIGVSTIKKKEHAKFICTLCVHVGFCVFYLFIYKIFKKSLTPIFLHI